MKNILAVVMLSLVPFAANADGYASDYAVITLVQPMYRDNYVSVKETVCYEVEVPVYETRGGASAGDVLAGAVIGGAIGNQFGSGSGKDAMTVLGAIVGANSVDNRRDVFVGYRIEQRCDRVTNSINQPVVTSYRIQYIYNGMEYVQDTSQRYTVGQRVKIQPALK
jgi:uncharacterized protein YcfJ